MAVGKVADAKIARNRCSSYLKLSADNSGIRNRNESENRPHLFGITSPWDDAFSSTGGKVFGCYDVPNEIRLEVEDQIWIGVFEAQTSQILWQ